MSGKIVDGATLRRSRLMDLIQQILRRDGMTSFQCQSYMMLAYGLKWERTSDYLRELTLANVIAEKDGKWVIRELPKDLF